MGEGLISTPAIGQMNDIGRQQEELETEVKF